MTEGGDLLADDHPERNRQTTRHPLKAHKCSCTAISIFIHFHFTE
jgi:hypothetical protein